MYKRKCKVTLNNSLQFLVRSHSWGLGNLEILYLLRFSTLSLLPSLSYRILGYQYRTLYHWPYKDILTGFAFSFTFFLVVILSFLCPCYTRGSSPSRRSLDSYHNLKYQISSEFCFLNPLYIIFLMESSNFKKLILYSCIFTYFLSLEFTFRFILTYIPIFGHIGDISSSISCVDRGIFQGRPGKTKI